MNRLLVVLIAANLLTFLWFSQLQKPTPATEKVQADITSIENDRTIWLLSERDSMPEVTAEAAPAEQSREGVAPGQEAGLAKPDPLAVTAEQATQEQAGEVPASDAEPSREEAAPAQEAGLAQPEPLAATAEQVTQEQAEETPVSDAEPSREDDAPVQETALAQPDPVAVTAEQATPEQPGEAPATDTTASGYAVAAMENLPPQPVDVCQTIGPFKDRTATEPVVTWLKDRDKEVSVRSGKMKVRIGYWVYLKKMPATEAERIMQELKDKGVEDFNQNDNNEISLGIYVKLPIAERRQKRIEALDYKPRIKPLYRNRTRYRVDVRETEADLLSAEEWDSQLADIPDSRRESMTCP